MSNIVASSIQQLFVGTTVKEFLKEQKFLITVRDCDNLVVALSKISENHISSVPVFHYDSDSYRNIIDTIDICCHAMKALKKYETNKDLEKARQIFTSATCGEVANCSRLNSVFHPILDTDTLKASMRKMVDLGNIHRLPVFNLSTELVGVISQLNLVHILANNISLFPMLKDQPVQLHFGGKPVVSVGIDEPLKRAFEVITENCLSGVPIINSEGVLVGNVSASDIKVIGPSTCDYFEDLYQPISKMLEKTQAKANPITVTPTNTVADVIKTLSDEKIHRVFVVDDKNILLAVLSPVDLLSLFLNYV